MFQLPPTPQYLTALASPLERGSNNFHPRCLGITACLGMWSSQPLFLATEFVVLKFANLPA